MTTPSTRHTPTKVKQDSLAQGMSCTAIQRRPFCTLYCDGREPARDRKIKHLANKADCSARSQTNRTDRKRKQRNRQNCTTTLIHYVWKSALTQRCAWHCKIYLWCQSCSFSFFNIMPINASVSNNNNIFV